ncbi:MAG: hypothetical protein R2867_32955 [Caldilineaceae bacterium]
MENYEQEIAENARYYTLNSRDMYINADETNTHFDLWYSTIHQHLDLSCFPNSMVLVMRNLLSTGQHGISGGNIQDFSPEFR